MIQTYFHKHHSHKTGQTQTSRQPDILHTEKQRHHTVENTWQQPATVTMAFMPAASGGKDV